MKICLSRINALFLFLWIVGFKYNIYNIICTIYIQGFSIFLMSFHKVISRRIPIQISSHFDSMFLSMSKFYA